MKKLFVLLILLLSFGRSQAADIEARTGILGGDGLGLQTEYEKKHTRVQKNQYSNHLHMKTNSLRYAATIPFV